MVNVTRSPKEPYGVPVGPDVIIRAKIAGVRLGLCETTSFVGTLGFDNQEWLFAPRVAVGHQVRKDRTAFGVTAGSCGNVQGELSGAESVFVNQSVHPLATNPTLWLVDFFS